VVRTSAISSLLTASVQPIRAQKHAIAREQVKVLDRCVGAFRSSTIV